MGVKVPRKIKVLGWERVDGCVEAHGLFESVRVGLLRFAAGRSRLLIVSRY
jgi:hypothetical protein